MCYYFFLATIINLCYVDSIYPSFFNLFSKISNLSIESFTEKFINSHSIIFAKNAIAPKSKNLIFGKYSFLYKISNPSSSNLLTVWFKVILGNCTLWFSSKKEAKSLLLNAPTCWVINNPFFFNTLFTSDSEKDSWWFKTMSNDSVGTFISIPSCLTGYTLIPSGDKTF